MRTWLTFLQVIFVIASLLWYPEFAKQNNISVFGVSKVYANSKFNFEKYYEVIKIIVMRDDGIMQILISVGSPLNYSYFYSITTNKLSDPYTNVFSIKHGKVITCARGKVIISDIFDKSVYYKEIIRNFSPTVVPASAIQLADWSDNDSVVLKYLEGEDYGVKVEKVKLEE
ncbi:MAG: hypothetical protein H6Q73_3896 [Firmicutes bacterium]|nr:hypothetical protein [Bacillota bacterium]